MYVCMYVCMHVCMFVLYYTAAGNVGNRTPARPTGVFPFCLQFTIMKARRRRPKEEKPRHRILKFDSCPELALKVLPCSRCATIHHEPENGCHAMMHLGIVCKELQEGIRLRNTIGNKFHVRNLEPVVIRGPTLGLPVSPCKGSSKSW